MLIYYPPKLIKPKKGVQMYLFYIKTVFSVIKKVVRNNSLESSNTGFLKCVNFILCSTRHRWVRSDLFYDPFVNFAYDPVLHTALKCNILRTDPFLEQFACFWLRVFFEGLFWTRLAIFIRY